MDTNTATLPVPSSLVTVDGLRLHVQTWPLAEARGIVVIVHGLGEHIGRYTMLATQLNSWGWHVAGFDQRGHGRSEGPRGGLARPDDLLRDLSLVIDAAHAGRRGPLVLLGHSMGGLIAARFVAEEVQTRPAGWFRDVDALVLSSPALDLGMSVGQKMLLGVLGRLAPGLAVGNGLQPAWISRDPAVVAAYVTDPLVHDRITPRLVRFMLDSGAQVHAASPRWKVPTLLLWAGSDRCVAAAGSQAFAAIAPSRVLRAKCFAPLFHEIFNEPEKQEVFAALGNWLDERRR